jgi:hypothetical protein
VTSQRIDYVRGLFEAHERGGEEALLALLPAGVMWHPFDGGGVVCDGVDELRAFWAARAARGGRLEPHADGFEEVGDAVIVTGVTRLFEGRGFRENSTFWRFAFDGEVLRSVEVFSARADAVAAAAEAPSAA